MSLASSLELTELFSDHWLSLPLLASLLVILVLSLLTNMTKSSAESQVAERRLRPIYDWLDNGNNKKALQEADKVLKKQPDFQCCKVLKCLALIRLGKEGEAESILNKVMDEVPVDEGALQAMTIAWRELQKPDNICKMYEGAVKKEPQNEEFLSHLFMSYVRLGGHKKQQLVAMNLYKAAHKNPYYFWSVMSVVLQAMDDERLGRAVQLPLALKMLQKMESEGKVEQEQEVLLFCLVLEMQEDWQAAVAFLKGPLGQRLAKSGSYQTFFQCKSIEWRKQCGEWEEVASLSRAALDKTPDQWCAWQDLVLASTHCQQSVPDVETFVKTMQDNHPEMRGPLLAEMELCTAHGRTSELPALIVQYYKKFCTKLVTYSDIVKYLEVLDEEARRGVYTEITAAADTAEEATSQAEICSDVIRCQLRRFCGHHDTEDVDTLLQEVELLVSKYIRVQPLVKDMVSTDLRPSDEYLVLASHLLWDLWHLTREDRFLLQCAVTLHWGLASSPANWQLKLMLIRVCVATGCGGLAAEVHASLDMKHLMLDSLGWVLAHHLVQCGQAGLVTGQAGLHLATMKFYTQVNKDTSDHIITAYRTGTFYQIRDIYKLRRRLNTSYNLMSTNTESQLYLLLHKTASHSDTVSMVAYMDSVEDEDWERKQDNRDLDTMVSWDPPSLRDPSVKQSTMRRELLYTRTRQLLVKCVQTAVKTSENFPENQNVTNGDGGENVKPALLVEYKEKLKSHWSLTCGESDVKNVRKVTPQTPSCPNLPCYKKSCQVETVLSVLEVVQNMMSDDSASLEAAAEAGAALGDALVSLSESVRTHSLHLFHRRELLEAVTWHLETVSLVCVLCGTIVTLMRGAGAAKTAGKKGKKGRGGVLPQYAESVSLINSAIDKFHDLNKQLEDVVNVFEANLSLATLADKLQELKFGDKIKREDFLKNETEEVLSKMESSFKDSFSQIKEALKHKQEYLKSIKL